MAKQNTTPVSVQTNDNPFSITGFLGHLNNQKEFSYASKFNAIISVPPFLKFLDYGRELILSCENAELPGVEINQIELRHYSFIQRVPARLSYTPVTLLFYCTGNMKEKRFFDVWADNIVPFHTGLVEYPIDHGIYSTVKINQFDLQGNVTYSVNLIDAYPISVSPVMLNWADDSVNKLQVVFAFKKWISSDTNRIEISDGNNSQPVDQTLVNNINNTSKKSTVAPDTPSQKRTTFTGGGGGFGGGGSSGFW